MASQPLPQQGAVKSRMLGTTVEIELSRDLDVVAVPAFERVVELALRDAPERVVIDLREVTFIDSSGIHALLRIHRRAGAQGAATIVLRPAGEVGRIFEICGLDAMFPR